MLTQPLVISVILNTNRRDDTLECLTSLQNSTYNNHRAIVLDNASTDGSVEAIQRAFPEVQIIRLQENLGYAGNNNVGIQAAIDQGAEWVFVLNEDTILAEDCLAELVAGASQHEHCGITGPMVYHYNEADVIQSAGGHLSPLWESVHIGQNELDRGQYNAPRQVDWISGCAIMVRRAAIEQAGKIDERFFYYYEETEWCVRIARAGWEIWHIPQAKLWHKGVQRDYQPSPNVTYYSTRNYLLLMKKHHAPSSIRMKASYQLIKRLISWTVRPKWRDKKAHRDALWQGMNDFWRQNWGIRPTRAG
jgi:GT2 family glycosyltransferase